MYVDGHVTVIFARKWRTLTVTPTFGHCSCWRHCKRALFPRKYGSNMAVGVHCIRPIYTCLEAFIVGNGTHRRNGRAVNYDSALLIRRHMHFRQIPSLCLKIADFGAFRPCGGHNSVPLIVSPWLYIACKYNYGISLSHGLEFGARHFSHTENRTLDALNFIQGSFQEDIYSGGQKIEFDLNWSETL